jgi:hypothetical protein
MQKPNGFLVRFLKNAAVVNNFRPPVYTQAAAFFSDESVRLSAPGVEDGKLPIGIKRH